MDAPRAIEPRIRQDLAEKMVFLAGPRQVGKTTVARHLLAGERAGVYYTWDRRSDRKAILAAEWPAEPSLIVLDELHKYRAWKRWIKGEFDAHRDRHRFLVTGSARMDVYRRGSDSLQGRYHHHRLHPFTLGELRGGKEPLPEPGSEIELHHGGSRDDLEGLLRFGGFPAPFLAQSEPTLRRWQAARLDAFFREDVRELENLRDLSSIELMADMLRERVGSLLSLNAVREDLEVSHRAVSHWLDILERLYFCFRVTPFVARRTRSLKKMPKLYMWDWSLVTDHAARFENLVASHLLKLCHALEDNEGFRVTLHYLRDVTGREVDFLVACDGKPWFAVEAKLSDSGVSPSLRYFIQRGKIPFSFQVVLDSKRDVLSDGVRIVPAHRFLAALS